MRNKKRFLVYLLCMSLAVPNLTVYAEPSTQTTNEIVTDIASDTDAEEVTNEENIEELIENQENTNNTEEQTTEEQTNEEPTTEEELQLETHFVGSPSQNGLDDVIITSQNDWDTFIIRDDDTWKLGEYVGNESNVTITINSDIVMNDITIIDNNTKTTNITITGTGIISNSKLHITTEGKISIEDAKFSSSEITIDTITDSQVVNCTLNQTDVIFFPQIENVSLTYNGNTVTDGQVISDTCNTNDGNTNITIQESTFTDNTKPIFKAKDGYAVTLSVNNVTATNIQSSFIRLGDYNIQSASVCASFNNCNVSTTDSGLTAIYSSSYCSPHIEGVNNCTFSGFDVGIYVYLFERLDYDLSFSDNTITDCIKGIHLENMYGAVHINNNVITCRDSSNTATKGIYFKTSGSRFTGNSVDMVQAILDDDLNGLYEVSNNTISGAYNGIEPFTSCNNVVIADNIITNCNTAMVSTNSGNTYYLRNQCVAPENPTTSSSGLYVTGSGGTIVVVDNDFTGFYCGIDRRSGGGGGAYCSNKIIDCIKYGIWGYNEVYNDTYISGATETGFVATGGSIYINNGFMIIGTDTGTDDKTQIGLDDRAPVFTLNQPSLSISGDTLTGNLEVQSLALTQRNLTNGNTEINNCDIGIMTVEEGSGYYTVGSFLIGDIYIHDCSKYGIKQNSTGGSFQICYGTHIKNCKVGVYGHSSVDLGAGFANSADVGRTEKKNVVIENCDIGVEMAKIGSSGGMLRAMGAETEDIIIQNCDIGLKATNTSILNHSPIILISNRIGADLTECYHPGTLLGIQTKDNTEYGIKFIRTSGGFGNWQTAHDSYYKTDADGSEPVSMLLDGCLFNLQSETTYTGIGKFYLIGNKAYIFNGMEYSNTSGTMEFDMPDGEYQDGRLVMALNGRGAGLPLEYEWLNQCTAKKEGWIVTLVPPSIYGPSMSSTYAGSTGFVLSEGCTVTYDYATNGGSSVTGVPIGNANYVDGGSVFDAMYETGNYWQDGYIVTSDTEAENGKIYYIKEDENYIECNFDDAKTNSDTIYEYKHYTEEDIADVRQTFVDNTTAYPVAQNAPTNKYNYKKGKAIDLVTPVATKDGWTFVGWNTDKNATEGLTSLTADQTNITLYAIYSKSVDIDYHTYDTNKDWSTTITVYNNTEFPYTSKTDAYPNSAISTDYTFIGYVLDANETDLVNNILTANSDISVTENGLDVYCVYSKTGTLTYNDYDNTLIESVEDIIKAITTSIIDMTYSYTVKNYTPEDGYTFNGWSDGVDGHDLIQPNTEYVIANNNAVLTADRSEIMITSLALSPKTASKKVGDNQQYTVNITPNNALNKDIVWTSSNENVATIDTNGKATVVGVGTTTITAKNNNSNKSDTATLMGVEVTVSPKTATLLVTDTQDLTATVLPEEANQDITWTSSNDEVATVNENGVVTAMKSGTVTITATNEATGASDTATITINDLHLTYNYAYNGGTSMSDVTETVYKPNDNADLTPIATKDGYTFIGWNTNKDATSALDTLTFERTDLTVYAIFKKEATVTYHTYDDTYTQNLVVYNNADLNAKYSAYNGGNAYTFEGYNLSSTTISDTLIQPNADLTDFITDVYCVYSKQGTLSYYNTDEQLIEPVDNNTQTAIADAIINKNFTYTVKDYTDVSNNKIFTGWTDKVDTTKYKKNDTYTTTNADAKLYATVNVANTDAPIITVNDTYKATITAGDVTNDELDKIYYRLSETDEWQEYTATFPVYGRFTIYAYQTTANMHLNSNITTYEGVEYATSITAVYNGDDVFVGDKVAKSDIVVTAHYPNSNDKVITNFTLSNDTINNVGENTVNISWVEYPDDNNCPELTTTVKVNGIEATTNAPIITISDDYKVTLTNGTITNDELDNIYYRINEGTWKEYTTPFPVYKIFKVEAYQTTKNRHLESEIALKEGVEYATGISAEYLGEDKFLQEEVTKPELKVTVHYPNSADEVVTNFNLTNTIITKVGNNTVNVSYNEYPNDENSPTLTTTVIVKGKKAITEDPIITISDDYKVTITPGAVTNDTLDKLYYRVNGGEWQEYTTKFPVYKVFKIEAYQVTKTKHIESNIVSKEGIEYANGITAQYLGEDKYLREKVINSEVKVTVHYPNSEDKVVTDFNLHNNTITKEGTNVVGISYNEYPEDENSPELTDTVNVIGKEASTDVPKVTVSKDYKITITAGKVTNDTLDKIYYKVNDGEWTEYTKEFPVYKTFKIQTYQTTKIRGIESEIVKVVGNEYPDSITAKYTGEPKPIGTKVKKSEVTVIVHYPNSPDEETTDFTLPDPVIKKPGTNDIPVEYLAYPEDPDCPTVETTVPVPAKEEEELRSVLVKGTLKYSDGTPIANKTIVLSNMDTDEELAVPMPKVASSNDQITDTVVKAAFEYKTMTDSNGYYEFKDVYVGDYTLSLYDNTTKLGECKVTVSDNTKKDKVEVTDSKEDVTVSFDIGDGIIDVSALLNIKNPEPTTTETPTTETPKTPTTTITTVKTGDNAPIVLVTTIGLLSLLGLCVLVFLRKRKK